MGGSRVGGAPSICQPHTHLTRLYKTLTVVYVVESVHCWPSSAKQYDTTTKKLPYIKPQSF